MFAKAEETRKAQNFPLAIEQYSLVIREHPKSDLAETSQFMLATVYHNDTHEYQKAINEYARYAQIYPEGKQNATAMFLIGFLYNNELHNLDSAAVAYRNFLAKYPQHEMASSAKFELDNLGKPPEELLLTNQSTMNEDKEMLERISKKFGESEQSIDQATTKARQLLAEHGIVESSHVILVAMDNIFPQQTKGTKYSEGVAAYVTLRQKGESHQQAIKGMREMFSHLHSMIQSEGRTAGQRKN